MARKPFRTRRGLACSFCGKNQEQVQRLIAGPGIYICDECIRLCNEILAEEPPPSQASSSVDQGGGYTTPLRAASSPDVVATSHRLVARRLIGSSRSGTTR